MESVAHITSEEKYPIVATHLESARREISRSCPPISVSPGCSGTCCSTTPSTTSSYPPPIMWGGPSAGFALALNTMSALLRIPLCIDFGITGAPTKGVRKDEVGGSVIIGGHRKKTEKVLLYLRRMYMPLQNYKDLEPEFLIGYWQRQKDIITMTHFADLMPEVLFLDDTHNTLREELIEKRIAYKIEKYYATQTTPSLKEEIIQTKKRMRKRAEEEILRRVNAIHLYLLDSDREKYIFHEQIFQTYMKD